MINKDDMVLNELALYFLLEYGRKTLKDDKEYNKLLDKIDNSPRQLFTPDYQKKALEQSRNFANLSPNDLYNYIIQNESPKSKGNKDKETR